MELNRRKYKGRKVDVRYRIPDAEYRIGDEILIRFIVLKFDSKTCLMKFYRKVLLNSE